jgi:hydrogenase maturation protease
MNILVIGVGNEFRGDDGVGLEVARALLAEVPPHVTVLEASGEGAALMEAWKGYERVIVVDATSSGSPPGAIHRFEAHREPLPAPFFHYSTHAFSVAEAIEMARALGQLPPEIIVYGIEGKQFVAGEGLSPEVETAASAVVEGVLRDLA